MSGTEGYVNLLECDVLTSFCSGEKNTRRCYMEQVYLLHRDFLSHNRKKKCTKLNKNKLKTHFNYGCWIYSIYQTFSAKCAAAESAKTVSIFPLVFNSQATFSFLSFFLGGGLDFVSPSGLDKVLLLTTGSVCTLQQCQHRCFFLTMLANTFVLSGEMPHKQGLDGKERHT